MEKLSQLLGVVTAQSLFTDKIIIITPDQFDKFVAVAHKVKEIDTLISDYIRVYTIAEGKNELTIVQETSARKREIILRILKSLDSADLFIKQRKQDYDDLWEAGCCGGAGLVKYYEPFLQ